MSQISEDADQKWPFEIWLRLAVLHMHISPKDFWDMNLRDWFVLCHREELAQFSKSDLSELMQIFPDGVIQNIDGEEKDN